MPQGEKQKSIASILPTTSFLCRCLTLGSKGELLGFPNLFWCLTASVFSGTSAGRISFSNFSGSIGLVPALFSCQHFSGVGIVSVSAFLWCRHSSGSTAWDRSDRAAEQTTDFRVTL